MEETLICENKSQINAKPIFRRRGFSLIETLVALSVFALIFLTIADLTAINFKYEALSAQQEMALRYSQSMLNEVKATENPALYANYNGDCQNVGSSALRLWCKDFTEYTNLDDEVVFHNLNVKTTYSNVAGSYNLKSFALQISWKNLPGDENFQTLKRIIYIYAK